MTDSFTSRRDKSHLQYYCVCVCLYACVCKCVCVCVRVKRSVLTVTAQIPSLPSDHGEVKPSIIVWIRGEVC